ncbi:MAG: serine protease Do [Candidatus Azotimanducaceae bacterium]|jgi:serine protease Do
MRDCVLLRKLSLSLAVICLTLFTVSASVVANARSMPELTSLVESASPAVVNITATRARPSIGDMNGQEVPEIFKRFFDQQQGRSMPRPRPAIGSGFIISSDGYILTNNHVIQDADEILVALSDRRERVATLIGADPMSDLALLKIEENDLPAVELGRSETLKVGEWVMAIGSPFGFEHSVTAGIVSAKGRSLPDESGNYVPYIQTDVAINPGNSGGPLLNLEGKVVGINSQIFTRSGGFMGLSFAIPIDVAMEVVTQLKATGTVSRGWLGVLMQRVDRDLAESFGLDRAVGALVTQIVEDSPADKSELEEGDIILEFNGHEIDLFSDLPHVVGRTVADSVAKVVIMRGGKKQEIDIKVGTLPSRDNQQVGSKLGNRLGLTVERLIASKAKSAGVGRGVLVSQVGRGPAETAGFQEGDVITTLDGESISSVSQFEQKVLGLPVNEAISVRVVRATRPEFLVIKILE